MYRFSRKFSLNSAAVVPILLLPLEPITSMTNALIVVALAGVGVYLVFRMIRHTPSGRGIDVGPVSTSWIAEHRREEPR